MRITHLGHACLLIETGETQLLIDPGTYSAGFEALTGLAGILVTHQHADHIDMDRLPDLLSANPRAELLFEPETAATRQSRTSPRFTQATRPRSVTSRCPRLVAGTPRTTTRCRKWATWDS